MSQWTHSVQQTFEDYCTRMRQSLAGSGADAEEVIDDLRRHIEEEIRSSQLSVVTEEDMQRILRRVGEPANLGESQPRPETPPQAPAQEPTMKRKLLSGLLLLIGIILPVFTLGFELVTGISAGVLFDPMPTWFHVLAVALVPAVNLWMWRAGRAKDSRHARLLGWLNGIALGVCIYYAVLYLPFCPFAAVCVIYLGAGLIPLGPFLALIATPLLRRSYRREIGFEKLPGLGYGMVAALAVLIALQMPTALTYYGLAQAASDDPIASRSGVRLLRTFGDRELMLRVCYGMLQRRSLEFDLVANIATGGHRLPADEARLAYYRATGQPFNAVPPPPLFTRAGRWSVLEEEFTWDDAVGGEAVAGRVKGLSLQSSRLDAVVEPDAAVGYCEWTLEFRNVSSQQREARAQIALPPGGVVSRLTLWVNGEEREAAFAGRSQVREAYQKVAVVRRRDPVLVTTCGPDRVLMQCFPIPPNGGIMKVRLGITAPLTLDSLDRGRFAWPKFLERNFGFAAEFKHALWIESPTQLTAESAGLKSDHPKERVFAVHGSLTEQELAEAATTVVVQRSPEAMNVWTPALDSAFIIRQTIQETTPAAPSRVVFVIDGSAGMDEHAAKIAVALTKLPETVEAAVIIAGDETIMVSDKPQPATEEFREAIRKRVQSFRFTGGSDNLPALEQAWDLAAERNDSLIVWIHAPQPFLLSSADPLRQRLERSSQSVRLVGVQVSQGPNRIAEKLDGLPQVDFAPRVGTVESHLTKRLAGLDGKTRRFVFVREQVERSADATSGKQASRHIERLWARDEAVRLAGARKRDEAAKLAARNQLVTPVSGAVVLETAQQYVENNLKPADPASVPAIPEPGTATLLAIGIALLLLRKVSGRNRSQRMG
jgi:Vault protein inter-alpha-trypsin domain